MSQDSQFNFVMSGISRSRSSLVSSPLKENAIVHEETIKQIDVDAPYLKVKYMCNQEVISMDDNISKLQILPSILEGARFFLLHSASWVNICYSQDNGLWASSPVTEEKLNAAFQQSPNVIVIMCVPQSSQYTGFARLVSVSENKTIEWETLEGSKCANTGIFKVEWLSRECVAFSDAIHLCKALDTSKPIITCNDGEELESLVGLRLCAMLSVVDATLKTSNKPVLDKQDLRHKISPRNTLKHLDLRNELNFRVALNNRLQRKLEMEPKTTFFKHANQHYNETSVWHYKKLGSRNMDKNYDNHLVRYQCNRGIPSLTLTHKSQEHMDFESYIGTHHVRPQNYLQDIQQKYQEAQYRQKHSMKDNYKQSHGPYHPDHSSLALNHFEKPHDSRNYQEYSWEQQKQFYGPQYHHNQISDASDHHHAARNYCEQTHYVLNSHNQSNRRCSTLSSLYHERRSPIAWDHIEKLNGHRENHHYERSLSQRNHSERSYDLSQRSYHSDKHSEHTYTKRSRSHSQRSSHSKTHCKETFTERVCSRQEENAKYDGEYKNYNRKSREQSRDVRSRACETKDQPRKYHHTSGRRNERYSSSSKSSSDYRYSNAEHKTTNHRKEKREIGSVSKKKYMNKKPSYHYAQKNKQDKHKMYKNLIYKYGKSKADKILRVNDDSSSSVDSSSNFFSSSSSSSSSSLFDEGSHYQYKKKVYQESSNKKVKNYHQTATAAASGKAAPVSDETTDTHSDVAKTVVCSDSAQPMTVFATNETSTENKHTNYIQICITGVNNPNETFNKKQQHRTLILLTK